VLRLYVCREINGKSLLVADLSRECHTSTWNIYAYLGIALIIICACASEAHA
jgi:hypothetical protein